MRKIIIFLLFLFLSIIPLAGVQAATVNISNNCNQDVTVYAYSTQTDNASDLLAQKVAYAHNSYSMNTSLPVRCIKTTYPQPGRSATANYFYFGGANSIKVKIGWDNNDCTIAVTE